MPNAGEPYPKYMIRIDDNRVRQIRGKFPIHIEFREKENVCFISDNPGAPNEGLSIVDVNGTTVPEDMAIVHGIYRGVVGFRVKPGAKREDFDFVVIKKPFKPDF